MQARLFQALQGLRLRHRTLLTGTPLQNDLSELFMLLHFLEPQRFDSLGACSALLSCSGASCRSVNHAAKAAGPWSMRRPGKRCAAALRA